MTKTPGTTASASLAVRCGAAMITSRPRTTSEALRGGGVPETRTSRVGSAAPPASSAATVAWGVAGAICSSFAGALAPAKRTTLRIFAATGLPSRRAGSNVHVRAAAIAARSNSGLTVASTSALVTRPSSPRRRTTGTTTSCVSAWPPGHAGAGCVFGRGWTTSWASAGPAPSIDAPAIASASDQRVQAVRPIETVRSMIPASRVTERGGTMVRRSGPGLALARLASGSSSSCGDLPPRRDRLVVVVMAVLVVMAMAVVVHRALRP